MHTYMDVRMDDSIDEELEHTILDNILQEWDEDDQMVEGIMEEVSEKEAEHSEERLEFEKDGCLETIFCEGDCQSISQLSCKASAKEWSRGENIQNTWLGQD